MVIEDNETIRTAVKQIIEDEGYSTEAAVNGEDALAILEATTVLPSLILLDINMPVMDGVRFRLAQIEHARLCKIPVVIVTAEGQVLERARQIKAQGWIRKPIEINELLEAIQKFCA